MATQSTPEGTVEKRTRINGHDARIDDAPERGYSRGVSATEFRSFIARFGDQIDPSDKGEFIRFETGTTAWRFRMGTGEFVGSVEAPDGWEISDIHVTSRFATVKFKEP